MASTEDNPWFTARKNFECRKSEPTCPWRHKVDCAACAKSNLGDISHTPCFLWHWKISHPSSFHTPHSSPQKGKFSGPFIFSGIFSDPLNWSLKISHPLKNTPTGYLDLKKTGPWFSWLNIVIFQSIYRTWKWIRSVNKLHSASILATRINSTSSSSSKYYYYHI